MISPGLQSGKAHGSQLAEPRLGPGVLPCECHTASQKDEWMQSLHCGHSSGPAVGVRCMLG